MNTNKLVCYRGVNDNQTSIDTLFIKNKAKKIATYLSSIIIENEIKVLHTDINIVHLNTYKNSEEECRPVSGYGKLVKLNETDLEISTSIYVGADEKLLASAKVTLCGTDLKPLKKRISSLKETNMQKAALNAAFCRYSSLNIKKIFEAYVSECGIGLGLINKEQFTYFERQAIKNFINFTNSSNGVMQAEHSAFLTIEQNFKLMDGMTFLKETFCISG